MTEYVEGKLAEFIAEHEGAVIDETGAYGGQSPDLIMAYVSALLGKRWIFPYGAAVDLWEDRHEWMTPNFERVADWQFETGDIAVFGKYHGGGTGTVGIITGSVTDFGIEVFTQTPGPARRMTLPGSTMLGAWRLTEGAECKALAAAYEAKRVGETPETLTLDMLAEAQDAVAGWGDPPRLKLAGDPTMQPGDIAVFEPGAGRHYGHVERVPAPKPWTHGLRARLLSWAKGGKR